MDRYIVNNSQVEACYIRLYTDANTYTEYDFDFGYSVLLPETVTYIAFCNAYSNFYQSVTINGVGYQGSSAVTAAAEIAEAENGYYTVTSLTNLGSSSYFAIPLEAVEYNLLADLDKGGYTVKISVATGRTASYLVAGDSEYTNYSREETGVYVLTVDNVISVYGTTVATGTYTGSGTIDDPYIPLADDCTFFFLYGQEL